MRPRFAIVDHKALLALTLVSLAFCVGVQAGRGQGVQLQLGSEERGLAGYAIKAENGRLLAWRAMVKNRRQDQVRVFDRSGTAVRTLRPMANVPDAATSTIWDVSAGPTGLVAVAGDFADSSGRVAASLLLYNPDGSLARAFSLPAEREIRKLAIDGQDTIWALGMGSGTRDPKSVSFIVAYDRQGNVVKQLIPRSDFPADSAVLQEGPAVGGFASFGLRGDSIWFWLPSARELVTVNKDGSGMRTAKTALPAASEGASDVTSSYVYASTLSPSGHFLAEVVSDRTPEKPLIRIYEWNGAAWRALPSTAGSEESVQFAGVGKNDEMALVKHVAGADVWRAEWSQPGPSF